MNARSYKTVFSKRLGALVAVGEHATSQGKANGASGPGASGAGEGAVSALAGIGYVAALSASFAFVSLAWAAPATNALPTGGTVVQGAASMSQNANELNITQSTQRAAINWQSFDIGSQARVQVFQPNAQAVLLNRVVGQSPSQIFGKLQANGHVILVNPNGVLFGKDGSVNAGGFTASTLNISDANFMAGNMVYERNGSTAGIENKGNITAAPGGYVALLGATVSNEGSITTKGGSVVMGAGETIKVPVSGTGRIKLELTPAAINASLSNTGSIVTEGGQVYMQALALNRAAAQILQSGRIDTTGEKGGDVHVLADGGHIRVDGRIKANSNNGTAGGDIYIGRDKDTNVLAAVGDVRGATLESQGSFIETSGSYLATNGVKITAKDWLLDPTDIRIVADANALSTVADAPQTNVGGVNGTNTFQNNAGINASEVLKSTIETAINAGTSVTISTRNTTPGANGSGNITLETALAFINNGDQDATFKLDAVNGITQNVGSTITAAGSKKVNIEMLAEGKHMGVGVGQPNWNPIKSKGIELNGSIITNGKVSLDGTTFNSNTNPNIDANINVRGVTFNSGSSIKADSFDIKGQANGLASGAHGVQINGGTSFESTGEAISTINGRSTTTATGITAGTNLNGTNIKFNAAGTGSSIKVTGSNANTGLGVRISASGDNTTVTTDGNVTFGELGVANSAFSMRAGSITANSGSLNILGSAVNNFGGESITANNGVSINIEGKTTAGSTSNAVSFTNMTIKALQGTAASAGNINITGTSSTGNAINLQPSVSIEGRDVTLNGTAANGTLASGAAINGSGKITASGTLKIEGVSANTGGYTTITNGPLQAAGDITIEGTGTAKHGVNLGNNVAGNNITSTGGKIEVLGTTNGAGGITGSASGSAVNGNAVITADKDVTITGKTHGYYAINGLGNITSNNGNVTIDGYSRDSRGVNYDKTITANNGLIKVIGGSGVDGTVTSAESSAGNEHGVYFSGLAKAKNVTIQGTSIKNVGTFVGSTTGTNIDATETVTIKGTSVASTGVNLGSNNGFGFFQATIKSGQDTEVTGKGLSGVRVWGTSSINAGTTTSPGSIKILGETINTTAAQTGTGVDFQRFPTAASMNASKDIYIEGTLNGQGNGAGIQTLISGTTGQSPTFNAGENFTLRGNNRGASNNPTAAINAVSGMQVTAGKNIVVQAETNNVNTRAMDFYSLNDGVRGNTSFVSTGGDVLIQSNQGSIVFNNQQTNTSGKSTGIVGRNITIDNTGAGMATGAGNLLGSGGTKGDVVGFGSIDTSTGNVEAGLGRGKSVGVQIVDTRAIAATRNLNITGVSTDGIGINTNGALTANGDVNLTGTTNGAMQGVYASNVANIQSGNGVVTIKGQSNTGTATQLQGVVTGKQGVKISGVTNGVVPTTGVPTPNSRSVLIENTITAETGNIVVTGTINNNLDAGQRAITLVGLSSKLDAKNGNIDLNTDSLFLNTGSATMVSAAGIDKGVVSINTTTPGKLVVLGNGASDTATQLGIDSGEIGKIAANKLVIGNADRTGNINVTGATTTNSDLELQTQGSIAINQALTVGTSGDKNLTLNATGNNSQITQDATGIITAKQLNITGTSAGVALATAANQVNQLAANVRSLDFKNGKALQIGVGNAGITASGKIKVQTTTGNLTITKSVETTNADADAVVLNAGADKTFNNLTGLFEGSFDDNIVSDGGNVIVGEGGVARLYTGSTSANTASLAGGDGTGRYRYNSDESTTSFSKALEAGVNVIYREAPEVIVKVNDVNKVYDGIAHSGGSFSSASTADGVKNGDADALVGSNAVFSGNAQGVKDVLASVGKTISALDNGKNALGYKVTYKDGKLNITPRPLTIAVGTVTERPADGTTTATVTPGALGNLVAGENLGVSAIANFIDANAGNGKIVTASYTLQNGTNGLASNYILNASTPNPDSRLRGNILAAVNPVIPIAPVNNNTGSVSRVSTVSGFGGAGAATGVLDDKAVTESREVCSDVFPENCECQPSVIPSIEICFAPKSVAATKEEK